jgi:L-aminoadipate-semialdehyde dehydrogenase
MPLNPNGKIDKPALPFPDTAQAAAAEHPRAAAPRTTSATEEAMQAIWARVLPSAPSPVPADTSFFDLGGHSILATRLIFEVRKTFVLDAPLGLVFERPTLAGLAAAVDELRNADLGLAYPGPEREPRADGLAPPGAQRAPAQDARAAEYASDLDALLPRLRARYDAPAPDDGARALRVFLTGATGFLGAFVLRDLLAQARVAQVVCLVRAKDAGAALARLRELSGDRGAWEDAWVRVVCGDLNLPKFGLSDEEWSGVAQEADVVLHNGALVSAPGFCGEAL